MLCWRVVCRSTQRSPAAVSHWNTVVSWVWHAHAAVSITPCRLHWNWHKFDFWNCSYRQRIQVSWSVLVSMQVLLHTKTLKLTFLEGACFISVSTKPHQGKKATLCPSCFCVRLPADLQSVQTRSHLCAYNCNEENELPQFNLLQCSKVLPPTQATPQENTTACLLYLERWDTSKGGRK